MSAGVRMAHICSHLPFLLPLSLSPGLRRKISYSSASSKECPQLYEECKEFLPWLQQKTGLEISSMLSVGFSSHGRSLFASKSIQAGECILRVPYSAQITSDKIYPEIESLLVDDVGNISQVAVVLLAEKKLGQDSEWAPYISSLPSISEMHNTIFWSEDELDMVRQSPIYQETIDQKAYIEKEFLALKSALEHFPQIFGDVMLEDFMHAFALVVSRAWGTSKGISLIPFADFLNHDGASDAVLLSDDDKEISEVIADRDYAAGEQVLISYGKFPNSTLLLDFGFTLPYNIHDQTARRACEPDLGNCVHATFARTRARIGMRFDEWSDDYVAHHSKWHKEKEWEHYSGAGSSPYFVQIWMDVPLQDPLYRIKMELLDKHCLQTNAEVNGLKSSRSSFIIKEVKSASGKGKGIPQALRAFARVLSTTSHEELEALSAEAAENDGRLARRSLKNSDTEIQAHRILLSQFTHMIQDRDAAVKVLESMNSPDITGRLAIRRQMARHLLIGELRVLKSACAWLTNYCASLPACSEREVLRTSNLPTVLLHKQCDA